MQRGDRANSVNLFPRWGLGEGGKRRRKGRSGGIRSDRDNRPITILKTSQTAGVSGIAGEGDRATMKARGIRGRAVRKGGEEESEEAKRLIKEKGRKTAIVNEEW